jgi:hypothetical protein
MKNYAGLLLACVPFLSLSYSALGEEPSPQPCPFLECRVTDLDWTVLLNPSDFHKASSHVGDEPTCEAEIKLGEEKVGFLVTLAKSDYLFMNVFVNGKPSAFSRTPAVYDRLYMLGTHLPVETLFKCVPRDPKAKQ